jgi:Ca-activated chloride channel family protein
MTQALHISSRPLRARRRGAMIVLVAIILTVLLVMTVFSINVAQMQLNRTQLRTATDAAARGGAEALSRPQSESDARQAALDAANANDVAGDGLVLSPADVTFEDVIVNNGFGGTDTLRGVRVVGRRTNGSAAGTINLLMGDILGNGKFAPITDATAVNLDRDICLVVDRSGSMNRTVTGTTKPPGSDSCQFPHPTLSRWAALDTAVSVFVAELNATFQNKQLGMVSYANQSNACGLDIPTSTIEAELDASYSPVLAAMANLSGNPVQGRTNITAGVLDGIDVLSNPSTSRQFSQRTMVLLTDGRHNEGAIPPQRRLPQLPMTSRFTRSRSAPRPAKRTCRTLQTPPMGNTSTLQRPRP